MRRAVYSRAMIARDAERAVETVENDPVPTRCPRAGRGTFAGLKTRREEILRTLDELRRIPPSRVAWDLTPIADLDDTGALWLARAMRGAVQVEASVQQREILDVWPKARACASRWSVRPIRMRRSWRSAKRRRTSARICAMRPCCWGASCSRRARSRGGRATRRCANCRRAFIARVAALPVTMLVGFLVGIVLTQFFRAAAQALRRRSAHHQHRRRRRSARARADARVDHRRGPLGPGDDRATR